MGIILYFCKLENILLPQFNTPVKYLLTMDSEQKPSNNPYADFRGLLEPEQVVFHGKKMRKMRSVEEFSDYCMEQDLDVTVQEPLIRHFRKKVCSIDFGEQLDQLLERISAHNHKEDYTKTTANEPESEVARQAAQHPAETAVNTTLKEPIMTFRLTEKGKLNGFNKWEAMLKGMERLNHLPAAAHGGYMNLLGVSIEFKDYEPLYEKIPFYSSTNTLVFWMAMMMGKFKYEWKEVRGPGHVVTHTYSCQPLITAPKEQYCLVLQNSILLYKHGFPHPIEDRRSLITAKKKELKADTAKPILELLKPLGCEDVQVDDGGSKA